MRPFVRRLSWVGGLCICQAAVADINVEFRPANQSVEIGATVEIGVYVVSDSAENQLMAAAQIIVGWEPAHLRLIGLSQAGATPLLSSSFPRPDPYGINEAQPPQDGTAMYVGLARLQEPVAATPEGTLLTTLLFEALSETPSTPVQALESAGNPPGETIIFDGVTPNTDVTGTLQGANVIVTSGLPAVLSLVRTGSTGLIAPGDPITIEVRMSDLRLNEAAGFQAFLEFDATRMSFVSGSYSPAPFGLPLITPISADGTTIDLASRIDPAMMQEPTSKDAVLAELTFSSLAFQCSPTIVFRAHDPATEITREDGTPILPLDLVAPRPSCPCDFNCDGVLNSQDFFDFVAAFFETSPRADFNFDAVINSQDFFDYLGCFFQAPPSCMN